MTKYFFEIYLVAWVWVGSQGIFSYWDGYLTQAQMHRRGITNGYSFMEHGGMWADAILIPAVVAEVLKYRFDYFSWLSISIFVASTAIWTLLSLWFKKMAISHPEAHTHDGKTTIAGWIHIPFASITMWAIIMFFAAHLTPKPSVGDISIVSGLLTPFFYLGVRKFNKHWKLERPVKVYAFGGPIIVWIAALVKIYYFS